VGDRTPRVSAAEEAPEAYQAMAALERAYCIDMHTKDARTAGETEQRLYLLDAWREAPFYSPRERAALAWTEAVTTLDGHVPDGLYEETRRHFSEKELVDLNWVVVAINAWNRLAIPFRSEVGSYQPAAGVQPLQPSRRGEVGR